MSKGLLGAVLLCSCLLFMPGCGGDEGGEPDPVTGVSIAPNENTVEIGHSTDIEATVTGGSSKALTWYVNDIENGDEVYGTITQNSPATYNAPDSLPSPRTVVIKAVSVEDAGKEDTCRVVIEFTKLFVDSAGGNDDTGNGCVNMPYRTITAALNEATTGMTVLVRAGTYTDTDGESFPMWVREGVSLVGENWETCVIRKETSAFDGAEGVRAGGSDAVVRKLTIRDAAPLGDARFYAPLYTDQDNMLIDSVRVLEHGIMACVRIDGATGTIVQNCVFDVTQDNALGKIMNRGFEVVFENQGTIIRNCSLSGFHTCMFFNGTSNALVEGCVLEDCNLGARLCCYSDTNHTPTPDFGGGGRGSAGGNTFRIFSECGFYNGGGGTAYAKFNTWHNDPPVIGYDYCVYGEGSETIIE